MTRSQAIQYAVEKIPEILPLEEGDIKNLCNQVLQVNGSNSESVAQGLLDILGHEDRAFDFVLRFNELLDDGETVKGEEPVKRSKSPAIKPADAEKNAPKLKVSPKPTESIKLSKNASRSKASSKPTESVKSSKNGDSSKTSSKAKRNQMIKEIDEVWKFLELDHNEKDAAKYACTCQGNRHPLFEAAPNCLSCGKIICAREGLHLSRCTFCGTEFIPLEERLKIVQLLKKEKEELTNESKNKESSPVHRGNNKKKYDNAFKISSGMGTNLFSEQDKLFDLIERQRERERKREEVLRNKEEDEKKEMEVQRRRDREKDLDPELIEAQERLNKLLLFQDTSAERTKIIDNASDFSMSNEAGLWGSARERALMLKKQQRNLRKWEKIEGERNGKREKYVVSMDIGPNGKVTMKEMSKNNTKSTADSDDNLEEISDEEDLNDLRLIHHLKDEIESDRNERSSMLQSKYWDYKKDKKQFEPPKYVNVSGTNKSKNAKDDKSKQQDESIDHEWKSRVQVDQDVENFWDKLV